MPIYNLKKFQHIMATSSEVSGLKKDKIWIDEFDEMYEKYEREENIMPKLCKHCHKEIYRVRSWAYNRLGG